jgi:hypothetical protein
MYFRRGHGDTCRGCDLQFILRITCNLSEEPASEEFRVAQLHSKDILSTTKGYCLRERQNNAENVVLWAPRTLTAMNPLF